ncbi:alpha/beta-tubulin-N-acetyltransferase 9 isoform X4 [Caretta caretta]|uniref:alpha/beta-tubulin-N-acetyltransferase 9 isoform X4 n=1 Tax=Caretta caretta TaxID=8467 RepID=UPI003F4B4096
MRWITCGSAQPCGRTRLGGMRPRLETMKINQNTVLQGKKVTLVPYTSAHVCRYHEWMKSEELQRLTASEPLSLEQEYEMQRSWQEDADKPSCRGRGFGKETTLIMMFYGVTKLGITKFEAKVGQENEASICMFKKLNFKEVAVNRIFQEVTLRLDVNEQQKQWLLEQTNHVEEKHYSVNLQTRASET